MVGPQGHSWPSIHWWLSLTASDQGAWVSGIGAFTAAAVALGIALNESKRRDRDRQGRAMVLAARLFSFVGLIRGAADNAIICMDVAINNAGSGPHVYGAFCTASRGVFAMKTSEIKKRLPALVDFPTRFAVTLAATPTIIDALCVTMGAEIADYNAKRLSLPEFVEAARRTKAQLDMLSANLSDFLRHYESKFVG